MIEQFYGIEEVKGQALKVISDTVINDVSATVFIYLLSSSFWYFGAFFFFHENQGKVMMTTIHSYYIETDHFFLILRTVAHGNVICICVVGFHCETLSELSCIFCGYSSD